MCFVPSLGLGVEIPVAAEAGMNWDGIGLGKGHSGQNWVGNSSAARLVTQTAILLHMAWAHLVEDFWGWQ